MSQRDFVSFAILLGGWALLAPVAVAWLAHASDPRLVWPAAWMRLLIVWTVASLLYAAAWTVAAWWHWLRHS